MAFDEKFDQVNKLISLGKEKGYLLYDEVNDLLPSDVHSAEDLSDLLSMFDSEGIEVVDSPRGKSAESIALDKTDELKGDETGEDVELDLTPGALDKTNDPGADVLARDGYGAVANARRRSGDRQAHRARPNKSPQGALAISGRYPVAICTRPAA